MRMRQTFFVASSVALRQAIGATVVAAFGAILALVRGSGLPIGVNDASSAQAWGEVWLGLLNRIGVADLALAVFLIAASLDAIRSSSKPIRIAARAFNPHALGVVLQRLIASTVAASLACGIGTVFPPQVVRQFASRGDLVSACALLWPTAASATLAFFGAVLLAALSVHDRKFQ